VHEIQQFILVVFGLPTLLLVGGKLVSVYTNREKFRVLTSVARYYPSRRR